MLSLALLLAVAWMGTACQPQIGDPCRTSQNCRPGHVCDNSVAGGGGYCTIFDCREGECPGGSVCVRFDDAVSACLAKCSRNRDCRPDDGYVCRRDVGDVAFCYAEQVLPSEASEVSGSAVETEVDVGGEESEADVDGGGETGVDVEDGDSQAE